jgi:hypothetical protein
VTFLVTPTCLPLVGALRPHVVIPCPGDDRPHHTEEVFRS